MEAALPLRANRKLARVRGLEPDHLKKLNDAGLVTCRDLLNVGEYELVESLNLYLWQVRELVRMVCAVVAPKPRNALQLKNATSPGLPRVLRTGLVQLDSHLGGGLPVRSITEAVGPAGIGKTQLCLTLVAHALLDGADDVRRVIYVDTEQSFAAPRLLQLLVLLLSRAGHADCTRRAEELAQRCVVWQPVGWDAYCNALAKLEMELLQHRPTVMPGFQPDPFSLLDHATLIDPK